MQRRTLALLAILFLTHGLFGQSTTSASTGTTATQQKLKVAIVITGTFDLLDVAGVREIFGAARQPVEGKPWEEGGERLFDVYLVSDTKQPLSLGGGRQSLPVTLSKMPRSPISLSWAPRTAIPRNCSTG